MITFQNKEIFDKYNNASNVVRCPNGRAKMRKPLDKFVMAAVNLYGVIRIDEFAEIFNSFHEDKTTIDEVKIILLPIILKDERYAFYKDYIVHFKLIDDFERADYLLNKQSGKPRYVPLKEEFIKYEQYAYQDNSHPIEVRKFMLNIFGFSKRVDDAYREIQHYTFDIGNLNEVDDILDYYDLALKTEKVARKFVELLIKARKNARLWENKGYTPIEMTKLSERKKEKSIVDEYYEKALLIAKGEDE